jgi:threonine synthase
MRLGELDPSTSCPTCGGLLDVRFHIPSDDSRLRQRFDARLGRLGLPHRTSGVWRFAELVLDVDARRIVSFPEGNTPLIASDRVAAWTGCSALLLKHEGMNPSGSFKDRGMTVGLTQARRIGARAVACASTGNTSASLAMYAALAGIPALVLVPSGQIALGKLTQTLAYGARTLAVRGDFDTCLALAREVADQLGVYLLNSVNPYRLEGQKSIVFELLQQLEWRAPDWIALPAGNLGNTAAFGKAIDEALACGLIDRPPRLLAVQAAGAAPFHRSFSEGFAEQHTMVAETIATAIRIGNPASYPRAARAIRETNGVVMAIADDAILDAQAVVGSAGIGCEPASAAALAGVRHAVREGLVARDERVVAVLTGHVLKDPGVLLWYHQDADPPPPRRNAPVEIDPSVSQVEEQLRIAMSL